MSLISRFHLERISDALLASSKPGIHLSKSAVEPFCGASRFGGVPDVGEDFTWPYFEGCPLGFLAQVNCAEASRFDSEGLLPNEGILYFFCDLEDPRAGYAPEDKGSGIVIYRSDKNLAPALLPSGLENVLPSIRIGFRKIVCVPSGFSREIEESALNKQELDNYWDLYSESISNDGRKRRPNHQLLGLPEIIQQDMPVSCQLVTNGMSPDIATNWEGPRFQELEPGASDWRLLLQIDTDEDLGVMWGADGILYFWIRDQDLRNRMFDNSWMMLQSY